MESIDPDEIQWLLTAQIDELVIECDGHPDLAARDDRIRLRLAIESALDNLRYERQYGDAFEAALSSGAARVWRAIHSYNEVCSGRTDRCLSEQEDGIIDVKGALRRGAGFGE